MNEPILVVDDNPDNLKLLVFLLRKNGYRVETAASAEEALVTLETFRPSLILMDIQLPGMDGLELTAHLKGSPSTRDIRIVVVTAYAMKTDEDRSLAAGCDGYIAKPIDTRKLPGVVAGYVRAVPSSSPP
jgi:CheY-like chemotaxis protein